MANLQKQFEQYHNTIRLDFDSQDLLREKRDIVLEKIEKSLKAKKRPRFDRLLQGSYKMKTGVFPINGAEYDIDVGLVFEFETALPKADEPRKWLIEAIGEHTHNVAEKTPCIRVHYKDSPPYHLDLVVYGKLHGKLHLATSNGWREADPESLLEHVANIQSRFAGTEGSTGIDQFRRIVRYLKRWGDIRVASDDEKPTGLAYTLLAGQLLSRTVAFDNTLDDATALQNLAHQASLYPRIAAKKPTPEYEDMFGRLSASQMETLKEDLRSLARTISAAKAEPDPHEACTLLVPLLGDDFPCTGSA